MMKKLLHQKFLLLTVSLMIASFAYGQVGINTLAPGSGAMLDVTSTNKGILLPRVALTSTASSSPITPAPTTSLLVYNTATAGSGATAVTPGFYFWSGTAWVPLIGNDWKQSGNAGTSPASNFVGTIDNAALSFRTNNVERFLITNSGHLRTAYDGTSGAPVFSWNGDSDTGFYRSGNNEISFVTNGTDRLRLTSNGSMRIATQGTAASPVISWDTDADTGIFNAAANQLGLSTGGTERLRIPNANQILAMDLGTNANPFYSFNGDNDTGIWSSQADRLNISSGGLEFAEFYENGVAAIAFNDGGADMNLRMETSNKNAALFVDGANDNIGLGTTTPNTSSQLELADTDRGILINRVALTSINNSAPVSSPATGLLVYNTANSGVGANQVLPGFYYWDGSLWVAMGGTNGRDWGLNGNAGTNPTNYFIGTTDATDFVVRTSNVERMRVLDTGMFGIGNAPYANVMLRVNDATGTQPFGIVAETSGSGASVYGIDSGGGIGVRGENFGTGLGVYGYSANSHGVYATTSYTGGAFLTGGIQAWGDGNNGANGALAVADKLAASSSNMGLRAVSGSTTSISSSTVMNVGVNTNATDLALYALSEGPVNSTNSIEAARFQSNYQGDPANADSRDPRAQLAGYTNSSLVGGGNMYYGAYLYSGGSNSNSSYAYAGARYSGTNYKIIGNGAVSTIVDGVDGNKKVMFAPEAPEVLFEDYGTGQLVNGTAQISIDPTFANNIVVDDSHPLKVFIQLEGDCNGVYVTGKSVNGFTVKELQSGSSNVAFSYHIVANRKNDSGNFTGESSEYENLRFPNAPSLIGPETLQTNEVKKIIPNGQFNDSSTNPIGSQK